MAGRGCRRTEAERNPQTYLARGRARTLVVGEGGRPAVILIGPVREPAHLEVIHRQRFYHVPVSAIAASRSGVSCVAFYEGATQFRRKIGLIREYAEVMRVSRVPRRDLPGLTWPGRGGEDTPYYRFDLGPIRSLPRPITNPERLRVVFRFPDLDRFHQAATIREMGTPAPADPPEGRPASRRRHATNEGGTG